ncbi:MAG: hypothetical protein ABIB11_03670 [Candidatus Omnitrophota bacterium]
MARSLFDVKLMPCIAYIASREWYKYKKCGLSKNDFLNAGFLRNEEAIKKYKENGKANFVTFAQQYWFGAIHQEMRDFNVTVDAAKRTESHRWVIRFCSNIIEIAEHSTANLALEKQHLFEQDVALMEKTEVVLAAMTSVYSFRDFLIAGLFFFYGNEQRPEYSKEDIGRLFGVGGKDPVGYIISGKKQLKRQAIMNACRKVKEEGVTDSQKEKISLLITFLQGLDACPRGVDKKRFIDCFKRLDYGVDLKTGLIDFIPSASDRLWLKMRLMGINASMLASLSGVKEHLVDSFLNNAEQLICRSRFLYEDGHEILKNVMALQRILCVLGLKEDASVFMWGKPMADMIDVWKITDCRKKIMVLRINKGLSQFQMESFVGIHTKTVWRYENFLNTACRKARFSKGRYDNFVKTTKTIRTLLDALGYSKSLSHFFWGRKLSEQFKIWNIDKIETKIFLIRALSCVSQRELVINSTTILKYERPGYLKKKLSKENLFSRHNRVCEVSNTVLHFFESVGEEMDLVEFYYNVLFDEFVKLNPALNTPAACLRTVCILSGIPATMHRDLLRNFRIKKVAKIDQVSNRYAKELKAMMEEFVCRGIEVSWSTIFPKDTDEHCLYIINKKIAECEAADAANQKRAKKRRLKENQEGLNLNEVAVAKKAVFFDEKEFLSPA